MLNENEKVSFTKITTQLTNSIYLVENYSCKSWVNFKFQEYIILKKRRPGFYVEHEPIC